MGLSITIKDVVFSKYFATSLPVTNGLKIHFDFGGSIESSRLNKVTGISATVAGTPTVLADSVIVSGRVGFVTDLIADTKDRTYIIVTKSAENSILVGHTSYNDPVNQPKSTAFTMTNYKFGVHYMADLKALGPVESDVGSVVRFAAGVIRDNTAETYVNATNALTKYSESLTKTIANFFPFTVGAYSTDGSVFPRPVETYEVLYFDRALSQSEIESIYLSLKGKYYSKGIVIA